MAHRVASEWLNGYKPSSLKGNRKRLLEADVDLAKQFRDLVLECLVSNVLRVDPDNPARPRAWHDGGGSCYIHVNPLAGVHPQAIFAIKVPEDPWLRFGFGREPVEIAEQRTGEMLDIPHPFPQDIDSYDRVCSYLFDRMREFLNDPAKDGQSQSSVPY